jgi:hypothetical protein
MHKMRRSIFMNYFNRGLQNFGPVACVRALLVLFAAALMAPSAMAQVAPIITVEGVSNCAPLAKPDACATTTAPVANFRWLVEEDKTYHVQLDADGEVLLDANGPVIDPNWDQPSTVSVSFHHSYMPVVMTGNQDSLGDLVGLRRDHG